MSNQDEAGTLPVAAFALPPRFMTDDQLRAHFGLSERALRVCRGMRDFPRRNEVLNKTDSKLVDRFFDNMSGLTSSSPGSAPAVSKKERF